MTYADRPMRNAPFEAPDFQTMADDQLLVVWYPFKVLQMIELVFSLFIVNRMRLSSDFSNKGYTYTKHNFFAGTETLSLAVHEPIAIRVTWGTVPPFDGRG